MRKRDVQRQRLYDAERTIEDATRNGKMTVVECQKYVDRLMEKKWIQARWGKQTITIKAGRYGGHARSGWNGHTITLGVWARQEAIILHEVAHCLIGEKPPPGPYSSHGAEYAGLFLALVRLQMGQEMAQKLKESFKAHKVRHNNKAIPTPKPERVETKAAARAKQTARKNRPLGRYEVDDSVEVIRRAIRLGVFGPAGRKARAHALEVARLLEQHQTGNL